MSTTNTGLSESELRNQWDYWYPLVYGYFYRRLDNRMDVEELTAETISTLLLRSDVREPKAFVWGTARNLLLNYLKQKSSIPSIINLDGFDVFTSENFNETQINESLYSKNYQQKLSRIKECINNNLKDEDHEIVYLSLIEDKNSTEIGQKLNLKPATVRQKLKRAIAKLREKCVAIWVAQASISFMPGIKNITELKNFLFTGQKQEEAWQFVFERNSTYLSAKEAGISNCLAKAGKSILPKAKILASGSGNISGAVLGAVSVGLITGLLFTNAVKTTTSPKNSFLSTESLGKVISKQNFPADKSYLSDNTFNVQFEINSFLSSLSDNNDKNLSSPVNSASISSQNSTSQSSSVFSSDNSSTSGQSSLSFSSSLSSRSSFSSISSSLSSQLSSSTASFSSQPVSGTTSEACITSHPPNGIAFDKPICALRNTYKNPNTFPNLRNCTEYHSYNTRTYEYVVNNGACIYHDSALNGGKLVIDNNKQVKFRYIIEESKPSFVLDGNPFDLTNPYGFQYLRVFRVNLDTDEVLATEVFARFIQSSSQGGNCDINNPNTYGPSCMGNSLPGLNIDYNTWKNKNILYKNVYDRYKRTGTTELVYNPNELVPFTYPFQ